MHFVDEPSAKVRSDGRNSAAQPNIFPSSGFTSTRKRILDAFGDEVKCRSALHRQRAARVVGEHEDLRVIRRFVSPPSFPRLVRPGASNRPEHISPDDPRADVDKPTGDEVIINAGFPTAFASHCLECASFEYPLVERKPAQPEWVLKALTWASPKSVDGHSESVNAQLSHFYVNCFSSALSKLFY